MAQPAMRPAVRHARDRDREATQVAQFLTLLRRAMEDTGWNNEALAAELAIDAGYISRLLSGQKAWPLGLLLTLPADLDRRLAMLRADDAGLITVEPVSGDVARRQFISGFFGLLAANAATPFSTR